MTGHRPLSDVLAAYRAARPGADVRAIERAYAMAARWHHGQLRYSGDPYITHPVAVAAIVAELGLGEDVVCAALLHDLPGDTGRTLATLREQFGGPVADLVAATAELDGDALVAAVDRHTADVAAGRLSRDVLVLKLADRLHNMRTMRYLPPAKQRLKSRETVDVLAPVAALLGMDPVRRELVDLASRILHPHRYGATASHRALRIAAVALPAAARARWLEEWAGELAVLPTRRARATFVLQILCGIPRLAMTLAMGRR